MNILILGGSEFVGKQLVNDLQLEPSNNIYLINRGKKYWNELMRNREGIKHYYGDRSEYIEFCKLIKYISEKNNINTNNKWDLVIDFSAFDRKQIKSAIRGLDKIYSVYDVCDQKLRRDDYVKEIYSIRPLNDQTLEQMNEEEEYGNDKLRCEEYLSSHVQINNFPYICLRMPDVIGPYDRSGRFWAYMMWIKNNTQHSIHVNKFSDLRRISLVYSKDVVKLIMSFLELQKDEKQFQNWTQKVHGQSYNICFDQQITLMELIHKIAYELDIKKLNFIDENDMVKSGKFFYPSVECGPISNSLSKEMLNFNPSDINIAIKNTVQFFEVKEKDGTAPSEFKKAITKYHKAISKNEAKQNKQFKYQIIQPKIMAAKLNKKILGIIYPIAIAAFVVFIYISMIVVLYYLNKDMMFGSVPIMMVSIIYLILFHLFLFLVIYCYLYVMFKDPGQPPQFWGFNDRPEERRKRYCMICNKFKPQRCHHCSTCQQCVLVMDHHCPWLNNCVGFKNRKMFMLLLIYAAILDFLGLIFSFYPILRFFIEIVSGNFQHIWHFIFGIIGYGFAITFAFIIFLFLKYHFELINKNMTTIEHLDEKRGNPRDINYDMGQEWNWKTVFGTNPLLYYLPIDKGSGKPQGDGTVFMSQNMNQQDQEDNSGYYHEDQGLWDEEPSKRNSLNSIFEKQNQNELQARLHNNF